jgi:2OG-Fe(II) oxygenase superfamily
MIKKDLIPFVRVYRNPFKDIKNIYNIIQNSQNNEKNYFINTWQDWGSPIPEGKYSTLENSILIHNSEQYLIEKEIYEEINTQVSVALNDYVLEYENESFWPININGCQFLSEKWEKTIMHLLKYNLQESDELIGYHIDENYIDADDKVFKHNVITILIYLNDDYSGGAIKYLHGNEEKKITIYKPAAGDILIAPSLYPFAHGVESIANNNKYFARQFVSYINNTGNKDLLKYNYSNLELNEQASLVPINNIKYINGKDFFNE